MKIKNLKIERMDIEDAIEYDKKTNLRISYINEDGELVTRTDITLFLDRTVNSGLVFIICKCFKETLCSHIYSGPYSEKLIDELITSLELKASIIDYVEEL